MLRSLKEICKRDVVIDTNILAHAHGGGGPEERASSLKIMIWMSVDEAVVWVLDDQGKIAPNPDTSLLMSEYLATLPPQSIGLTLLAAFLSGGRVSFSPRPRQEDATLIRRLLPKNKFDRAVLGASIGSINKVLITNDHADFTISVRRTASKKLAVTVLSSSEVDAA